MAIASASASLTFTHPLLGGILISTFTLSMQKHIFAAKFKQTLINKGIPEKSRVYHHRHLTHWGASLRAENGAANRSLSEEERPDYSELFELWIRRIGGNPRTENFQIRQAVDSVHIAHGNVLEGGVAGIGEGRPLAILRIFNYPSRHRIKIE